MLRDSRGFIVVEGNTAPVSPEFMPWETSFPARCLPTRPSAEGIAAVEAWRALISSGLRRHPLRCLHITRGGWRRENGRRLKGLGIEYRAGVYPFAGTGRARCLGETDGFVKILAHARSDRILGVHILGPRASELIAECALAMRLHTKAEDLRRTVHAHPTLAEAVRESAVNLAK